MKKKWISIAVLAVLACLCIKYSDSVIEAVFVIGRSIKPLLYGFFIAYALNILMKKLERIYFPNRTDAWVIKTRRPVSIFISVFLVLFIIVFLVFLIIPALGDAVYVLTKDIPKAFQRFQVWTADSAADAGFLELQEFVTDLEINWNDLYQKLMSFLSKGIGSLFNSAFSVANVMTSFIFTGIISIIFSVYMLFQKENIRRQLKKAASVYLPAKWRTSLEGLLHLADESFSKFITGQILEAFILGTLCGAGMFVLRLPYALMTGVIVGVSALIPIMGAYIGACVGAFMILTVSPFKALVFLIYLVILQQLEGNLIYPRVVGGSIGLPGIWVLGAVTVGGGLFGVMGMLLGVPLTATLYKWTRLDVNRRIQRNHVPRGPQLFRSLEEEQKIILKEDEKK